MTPRSSVTGDPIITLTTDYGTSDYYVAALKGVIVSIAPAARIVDITHDIEPQDIVSGAFVLRQAWTWFPPGTIHLAIVDPGVGTARRILLGRYAGSFVVAPDNGLISFVHRELTLEAMHIVEDRRYFLAELSSTFHGRDIMAPVAANLARGVAPREFGRATDRIELLDVPHRAQHGADGLIGRILHVDQFGTLVTNVHADQLALAGSLDRSLSVVIGDESIGPIRRTFSDVAAGDAIALIGGSGYLEIAVNQGRAVDRFGRTPTVRIA